MKYILRKRSSPGWSKEYFTERELCSELRKYICSDCMSGWSEYVGYGEMVREQDNDPYENNDWFAMLGTSCGCEFEVDEEWDSTEEDEIVFGNKIFRELSENFEIIAETSCSLQLFVLYLYFFDDYGATE